MKNQLPTFSSYCGCTEDALVFTIGNVDVYFSHKTPVAFRIGGSLIVRNNIWGSTTGKHLDAIDGGDKKARVSGAVFVAALAAAGFTGVEFSDEV